MILHKIMDAKAPCGTHRSDAVKVFSFSDFVIAELFSSAFLFSTKKVDLSARSCPNKFGRDACPLRHPRSEAEGIQGCIYSSRHPRSEAEGIQGCIYPRV